MLSYIFNSLIFRLRIVYRIPNLTQGQCSRWTSASIAQVCIVHRISSHFHGNCPAFASLLYVRRWRSDITCRQVIICSFKIEIYCSKIKFDEHKNGEKERILE